MKQSATKMGLLKSYKNAIPMNVNFLLPGSFVRAVV